MRDLLSPARAEQALAVTAPPRLEAELEHGQLDVPHAMAVLSAIRHLDAPHAAAELEEVLGHDPEDVEQEPSGTPGELRAAVERAAIAIDPEVARNRHEAAKKTADVRSRATVEGEGADRRRLHRGQSGDGEGGAERPGRRDAVRRPRPDRRAEAGRGAAACPGLRSGAGGAGVPGRAAGRPQRRRRRWGVDRVDVGMPVAVAMGLSDHPGVLAGFGPIGAEQARALLPAADLVRACVDAATSEVLPVDPPVRAAAWTKGDAAKARALRQALISMATSRRRDPRPGQPRVSPDRGARSAGRPA